jgi:hypothetical protein
MKMPIHFHKWLLHCILAIASIACLTEKSSAAASPFAPHPAAAQLDQVFTAADAVTDFTPSKITRRDYLTLIAGDVDFFKQHQNASGAIIDPNTNREVQYSTPAFAVAAGILATQAGRTDLLQPAINALSRSITALVTATPISTSPSSSTPIVSSKTPPPRRFASNGKPSYAKSIPPIHTTPACA